MKIPFNKIFLEGSEMANIKEAIDSGTCRATANS